MIRNVKKILSGDLIKVFSFTSLSTIIKLITSYVTIKIVAFVIGPSGIALLGQLQNFASVFTTLGAGGINNGVVKYVAEHKDERSVLQEYLQSGLKITFLCSLIFGAILILFCVSFSRWILLDSQYYYVFIFFGCCLIFISLNNFLLSILNGFKDFKKFVFINVITSLVGLAFTVTLVLLFELKGALISVVTFQGVVFFVTIFLLKKKKWFSSAYLWGTLNKDKLKKYGQFSLMALVSAATVPISQLLVRGHLITEFSAEQAGIWEGMNRISGLYLLFVTTSFGVYYLPKLSETKSNILLRKEIFTTYKIITPIIVISLFLIYILKDFVINILFTKEFYQMKELFFWQLLGDFFKILSWILAFLMVAKSMTKIYIFTEIFFASLFVGLSHYFIDKNGLIGATQSYCVNYFIYLIAMIIIFRNLLFNKSNMTTLAQ